MTTQIHETSLFKEMWDANNEHEAQALFEAHQQASEEQRADEFAVLWAESDDAASEQDWIDASIEAREYYLAQDVAKARAGAFSSRVMKERLFWSELAYADSLFNDAHALMADDVFCEGDKALVTGELEARKQGLDDKQKEILTSTKFGKLMERYYHTPRWKRFAASMGAGAIVGAGAYVVGGIGAVGAGVIMLKRVGRTINPAGSQQAKLYSPEDHYEAHDIQQYEEIHARVSAVDAGEPEALQHAVEGALMHTEDQIREDQRTTRIAAGFGAIAFAAGYGIDAALQHSFEYVKTRFW